VRQPLLLAVFAAAAMVLTSHTVFNVFGSIYLRQIGYSERSVGALWALATSAEVAMFWAGPRLATVLGPFGLLTLAAGAALVRWSLMALAPGVGIVVALQLLHSATFSCSYLGLMRFVETNVTDERGATAQSAFVTMAGLMTAGATLAVGPVYAAFGSGAFLAAAGLAALALALLAAVRAPLRAAETLALSRQRQPTP
jgi:PPP family 3-phenylpropionic acid transporter